MGCIDSCTWIPDHRLLFTEAPEARLIQTRERVKALEREVAQARAELETLESDAGSEAASIVGSPGVPQQTRAKGMVDASSSPADDLNGLGDQIETAAYSLRTGETSGEAESSDKAA